MRRNRHNGARPVRHQHIVGDPDRNFFAVDRIDCTDPVQDDPRLLLCQLRALKVGLLRRLLPVSRDRVPVPQFILIFIDQRMFG